MGKPAVKAVRAFAVVPAASATEGRVVIGASKLSAGATYFSPSCSGPASCAGVPVTAASPTPPDLNPCTIIGAPWVLAVLLRVTAIRRLRQEEPLEN